MAMSMDAILNIKANVTGEGALGKLASGLGSVQTAAGKAGAGLKGLAGGAGGLGGALSGLVPLVSAAGLVAMGKSAINAADDMNDLAQKTGVSVENLSKFQQAAKMSGTDIDGVGKAMNKLNKGLGELAATGKSDAGAALAALGISAKDASGKIKGTDQVMLEVADKFKAMPDGAAKASAAMAIFGKSGADLIPLLNGGRASIEGLTATMSTGFAKASDELNDKMEALQAKFLTIGVQLGTVLMPAFNAIADGVMALVDGFTKLPGPVQGLITAVGLIAIAFVALAPAISAIIGIVGALGPVIAGVVAAFTTMGAAIASLGGVASVFGMIAAGLAALVSWPVLIVAGIIAAVALIFTFRDQIGAFFVALGQLMVQSLTFLGQIGYTLFVAPWVAMWELVKAPVMGFFSWLGGTAAAAWTALSTVAYQLFVEPMIKLWDLLKIAATAYFSWWQQQWVGMSAFVGNVFTNISNTFNNLLVKPLTNAWKFIVNTAKGAIRGLLQWAANAINGVINIINNVIRGINRVRAALRMSTFSTIGTVSVPAFAQGGFVTGPTLAVMGDNAGGREYAVPEGKAVGFANNILAGRRGASAIPSSSSGGAAAGGAVTVNITTGPVMQDASGQQWMTVEDGQKMAGQIIRQLRTPAGRYATGVR